jgi:hypothetical protein
MVTLRVGSTRVGPFLTRILWRRTNERHAVAGHILGERGGGGAQKAAAPDSCAQERFDLPSQPVVASARLRQKGRVVAIADAKYRDLWERDLPRDMLYQLTVYALSHRECTTATILSPTSSRLATESRISINDPISGRARAQVCLRPVDLPKLADLVSQQRSALNDRRRRDYCEYLLNGIDRAA